MAERVRSVPTPAPVAALVGAWNDRSADRFAAAFAPEARLTVPPLHLEFEGRDDIWDAVGRLFGAFGALRYTLRHRYLSPDGITDEALLEGLQTLEFLGAPPPGKPGAVAARVMLTHDGSMITSLTLWPDVAALRELSDGVARRIDLRTAGPAAPVVAALRATIPAPEGKFSIGQGRQLTAVDEVSTLLPGGPGGPGLDPTATPSHGIGDDDGKGRGKKGGPKAPLPRKVKRRRAIAAGIAMLAVAGVLVAYVAVGVNRTKVPVVAEPTPSPTAAPTTATQAPAPPPTTPKPSPSPSPTDKPLTFDPTSNKFTVSSTLLFELNSATLRPDARQTLTEIVQRVERENRLGTITVTGYTDDTGPPAFNKDLSTRRARVVAAVLRNQLGAGYQVRAFGKGKANPAQPNTSDENRAKNRRVEVVVPPPPGAAGPAGAPTSASTAPAPAST